MGLAGYVCFMTALSVAAALLYTPSMRLLAYVHCPRYYVVRRVDYLHYRIERAHYLLRFVASCISVRIMRGAEAFAGLVSLVGAATVLNVCMEVGLRVTGQRQMRLRAYSRLPSVLAVLLQAFFEGGMRQRGRAFSSVPTATPSPRLTKRAKRRRLLWHVLRLCAAFERGRYNMRPGLRDGVGGVPFLVPATRLAATAGVRREGPPLAARDRVDGAEPAPSGGGRGRVLAHRGTATGAVPPGGFEDAVMLLPLLLRRAPLARPLVRRGRVLRAVRARRRAVHGVPRGRAPGRGVFHRRGVRAVFSRML